MPDPHAPSCCPEELHPHENGTRLRGLAKLLVILVGAGLLGISLPICCLLNLLRLLNFEFGGFPALLAHRPTSHVSPFGPKLLLQLLTYLSLTGQTMLPSARWVVLVERLHKVRDGFDFGGPPLLAKIDFKTVSL